ncbi:MAG TPA: copper resistance protein B [Oleiagrimonas sp.]|nr:copper resistance protein B [Oleiagrimonas sp.]
MKVPVMFGVMLLLASWATVGRAQQASMHDHHGSMSHMAMPMPASSVSTPAQVMPLKHTQPEFRSPDYSDGLDYGSMPGMDMVDDTALGMLRFDQLEAFHGREAHGQRWDMQGWYGNDIDKLWLRSEGERTQDGLEGGDVELLWNHATTAFWNTQLGIRHDLGEDPERAWIAFGVEGLAPYFLDVAATLYAGPSGRTAVRLRVEYELLFTQRLILQPEFEANLYGKDDPQRGIGAGLSDASLGLRLRYEIRRRFAPYLGVVWQHRFGATSDLARAEGHSDTDWQWVAGLRLWF